MCVSCSLLPYGGFISPQCKHSWLPPVAAWVNSSLPADTKSPNMRITFTVSTLIWLLGTLEFMVCYWLGTLVSMFQPDIQTISDVKPKIIKSFSSCSRYVAAGTFSFFLIVILHENCNLNMTFKMYLMEKLSIIS